MEAVNRVAASLTDIEHRAFCPLPYTQALLGHGFAPQDERCGITTMSAGFHTVTSWWF